MFNRIRGYQYMMIDSLFIIAFDMMLFPNNLCLEDYSNIMPRSLAIM